MALLTTQNIVRTGLTPSFGAVTASDTFVPDANTYLYIKNGGGSADTIAIDVNSNADPGVGLVLANAALVASAGLNYVLGPFPSSYFADSTGLATITHSFTTSVTIAVLKLGQP